MKLWWPFCFNTARLMGYMHIRDATMRETGLWGRFASSVLLGLCFLTASGISNAKTAEEIDASVNAGLDRLKEEVKGADKLLDDAKGVLVIPGVLQAGVGIGGEYGEGALQVGRKTVAYYRLVSGSFGFQLGAQKKDVILLFMTDSALEKFRSSDGWEAGVDGSVALVKGVEGSLDTATLRQPILGFVVGQKGLMYNLSLEGTKFTKIDK